MTPLARRRWQEPLAWLALLAIVLATLHWHLAPSQLVRWLSSLPSCG